MTGKEKILYTLKRNKEYRNHVIDFVHKMTNQPVEIIEATLDLYLEEERSEYIKQFDGRRSMTAIKYLWAAEEIVEDHIKPAPVTKLSDEHISEVLKKKTLLIKNVKVCPACQSEDTYLREHRENNGILGPGFKTWVINSYWVCDDCGIHFTPKENNIEK
jgi:hypothetical protein